MENKIQSRFELLEHTGDLGLEVWSESPEAIFETAACGLFSIIADLDSIHPETEKKLSLQAISKEELLVDWLRELNLLCTIEDFLFCQFRILELKDNKLDAIVTGEQISPDRHNITREVKAVTYHDLVFEKRDNGWFARVIFDL